MRKIKTSARRPKPEVVDLLEMTPVTMKAPMTRRKIAPLVMTAAIL